MAEASSDEDLVSEGFYRAVSDIIGSESMVELRRTRWKLKDIFTSCHTSRPLMTVTSGSMAEGFSLKSSDLDCVHVDNNVIVLNCISSHLSNTIDMPTVLIMETDHVPPGFALLRCMRFDERQWPYHTYLVTKGNNVYVSSRVARESHLRSSITRIHGPSSSGILITGREYYSVYTLRCPFWPRQAESFIYRSLRVAWPSYDLLTDMCTDGCFLVPINSRKQRIGEFIDLEWRISFTQAEKKLVHSMNYCQFLCYGLMKIFLNEVLKVIPEAEELLCSYFMKTAVFWEISKCPNDWSPSNFIAKFWNVFRRIMNWVSVGYCPNYFIPEHNMFYDKMYGKEQRDLLFRLRTLYDDDNLCLFHSTSLTEALFSEITEPVLVDFEMKTVGVIAASFEPISIPCEIIDMTRILCKTASLKPKSDEMTSAVRLMVNYILQRIGVVLHSSNDVSVQSQTSNKLRYCFVKTGQSILSRTKTFLCLNSVYSAVCTFRNGDYKRTIQTANHVKQRLKRQQYMYIWDLDGDKIMECRQQGMLYDTIIKTFIASFYKYEPVISIEHLYLEGNASKENTGSRTLYIPPLVILNFLLVLSFKALHEVDSIHDVLCELHSLLQSDDDHHIFFPYKAISWEILGICQQLCGDYHGAYQSFINALNDKYIDFKQATIVRITILVFLMLNQ